MGMGWDDIIPDNPQKSFEDFASEAAGKHPNDRSPLEHEIIRQLVRGREDAARALYAGQK